MPIRHYAYPTKNRKNIKIRDIGGLPDDVQLKFQSVDIRYHQSQMQKQFFFCTVHLPNQKDDEGYDLELEIMIDDLGKSYDEVGEMIDDIHQSRKSFKRYDKYDEYHMLYANDDDYDVKNYDNDEFNLQGGLYSYHYEVRLNDVKFDDLKNHTKVWFETPKDAGGYLVLKIKISGTSYQGMVIIDGKYLV
ncbi:MAG: hypothetical protein Q4B79_00795 [Moraxella sp.]|uniref:hypothetical protein n=1 Tax=Moraxella sp. TaxID=479 RepID=UPI0026DBEF95|nr:hypothetical protein [Moraxella sp.]MDO4449482.1 hypothetical protein [Moraxella sp.]